MSTPQEQFAIALRKIDIDQEVIDYLLTKRVRNFVRIGNMDKAAWDTIVEDSDGAIDHLDVKDIQVLAKYHLNLVKEKRACGFSWENLDLYDFYDFQEGLDKETIFTKMDEEISQN